MKRILSLLALLAGVASAQPTPSGTVTLTVDRNTGQVVSPANFANANASAFADALAPTFQPLNASLTHLAAGSGYTAYGRATLSLVDAAAGRAYFGVIIGEDVQPFSANLAALSANAPAHYLSRANHTDTQPISTVAGLQVALDSKETPAGAQSKADAAQSAAIAAAALDATSKADAAQAAAEATAAADATTKADAAELAAIAAAALDATSKADAAEASAIATAAADATAKADAAQAAAISAAAAGNAATATALQTPRTINGVAFDGTANVTVPAAAGTLSGPTLAANVTASSLTSAAGGTFGTAAFTASTAYATAAQGGLADTAVQPGALATVATSGAYNDLTGKPVLGTAAAAATTDFATAAQGILANSALQPAAIGTTVQGFSSVLEGTTASFTTALESKLGGIAAGATVGATWGSNITGQPAVVSQADAEAGSSTTEYMWTPQRIAQAIAALAAGGGGEVTLSGFQELFNKTMAGYTLSGAVVAPPIAVVSSVIDVDEAVSTVDITDSTTTLTFSATPSTGTGFRVDINNLDGSNAHTVTLPAAFSQDLNGTRTSITVPANGQISLGYKREASRWVVIGDGQSADELPIVGSVNASTDYFRVIQADGEKRALISTLPSSSTGVSNAAFGPAWDGGTTVAPSQQAVRNIFTNDGTLSSNSDEEAPTVQAVKTYVDNNSIGVDVGIYALWPTATLGSVPNGWLEADGTEGTENMTANAIGPLSFIARTNGVAPVVSSAAITTDTDVEYLDMTFTEDGNVVGDGTGISLELSGGATTLSYQSGSGTNTWRWAINRRVLDTETGSFDYAPGNMADALGNLLATITDGALTNNSTYLGGSSTPTFVGVATTNLPTTASPTVNKPATLENDVMLMYLATDSTHVGAATVDGWTRIRQVDCGTNSTLSVYWKRAGASESTSETMTNIFSGSELGKAAVLAYRGCTTSGDPYEADDQNAASTSVSTHNLSTTTLGDNRRVVMAIGTDPAGAISMAWDAPTVGRVDERNGTSGYVSVGDFEQATAGFVSMGGDTDVGITMARIILALKP